MQDDQIFKKNLLLHTPVVKQAGKGSGEHFQQ